MLFLLLCYGRKSDLVVSHENLDERRKIAAQIAKIEDDRAIIELEDDEFRELLDYYLCEIENHTQFNMLVSCELTFREYQQHLRRPMKTKETIWEKNKDGQDVEKEKIVMSQEDILKACETKGKLEELSEKTAGRIEKYRAEIYKLVDEKAVKLAKRAKPENMIKK